jgi:arsenical pump membrane protein
MMALSALAEAAGLFDWLAVQAARLAGQSAARLFLNVFLLGTLISMVLSNDATALILTPIVYVLVTKLRLPVLPYLFACTFIADTASFLLPVSNPINIIITSRFPLDLWTFLRLLFLPSLVVIAINIGIFYLLYRKQLKGAFDIQRLPSAEEAAKHKGYFRYTCCVLAAVAVAYVVASAIHLPLSLIALSGALLLLSGALSWGRTSLRNCEPGFLVHPWVYRRNVYCGPGDRGYGTDHDVWKLANPPLRKHELWRGDDRDGWSSSRNEPDMPFNTRRRTVG